MQYVEETSRVRVAGEYDVVVAGGGVAGIAAALAARRAGKRALLIEKSLKLGGLATLGLINLFVPMCNGRGTPIIGGMCEELLRLSIRLGYDSLPEAWSECGVHPGEQSRYVTRFSPDIFAMELSRLLDDEGVDILYDALAVKPVMQDARCTGVIIESKSGREFYGAGVVIDATGDADLLERAGVPTKQGGNYFTYIGRAIDLEHCKKAIETGNIDNALYSIAGGGASLYGDNQMPGKPLMSGVDVREISRYIVDNHKLILEKLSSETRFERDVVQLPGMPQFRTTRHIDGDYTLRVEDAYRHFDDSVGAICDFDRRDYLFEVPLRCLVRREYPNLITAGRSASACGYAWDVLRVIPPAIQTGQAAGIVAAHALDEKCAAADVDIAAVQSALSAAGVRVHFDDGLIPQSENAGETVDVGHI